MTRHARRGIAGSVLVVLTLVVGAVIVTALQAEGRERTRADTNDGGAWLLKRDAGYVGHVNRAVGEVTAAVSAAEPGSDYDIDQAADIIVVHDRTTGTVSLVDDRAVRIGKPGGIDVGNDVSVHAVDGGALIVDRSSMAVRRIDRAELLSLDTLDAVEPIVRGEGPTIASVEPDGHAALVDQAAGTVVFLQADGSTAPAPRSS